jgi:hypothetical protein
MSFTIYLWLYSPLLDLGRFFSFLSYTHSVGLFGRRINPSQGHYLHAEQHKHRINTQTSMPWVGIEPTIPGSERAKTVHTLDSAASGIGNEFHCLIQLTFQYGNEADKRSKIIHFCLTTIHLFTRRLTSHNTSMWRLLPPRFVPVLVRKAWLKWVALEWVRTVCKRSPSTRICALAGSWRSNRQEVAGISRTRNP